jgi:hypothetical protein
MVYVTCLNTNTKYLLQAQQTLIVLKAFTTAHKTHLATKYSNYSTVFNNF